MHSASTDNKSILFLTVTVGNRHNLHNLSAFNRQLRGEFPLFLRLPRIPRQLSEPETKVLVLFHAFLTIKLRWSKCYNTIRQMSSVYFRRIKSIGRFFKKRCNGTHTVNTVVTNMTTNTITHVTKLMLI